MFEVGRQIEVSHSRFDAVTAKEPAADCQPLFVQGTGVGVLALSVKLATRFAGDRSNIFLICDESNHGNARLPFSIQPIAV
jgi:hypothetical protein